ncbi:MAG: RsbRD N-terminal domain-containing protein [Acidobacteriaceae bacterium]
MRAMDNSEIDGIAKAWLIQVVQSFPLHVQPFLERKTDPFRNPMGHAIQENLSILLQEILGGMDHPRLAAALEAIVRIRAVQETAPSKAVEFLFQLPPILREQWKGWPAEQEEVLQHTQQAALIAFDLYIACREKIFALQADEARRRTAQLERVYQRMEAEPR